MIIHTKLVVISYLSFRYVGLEKNRINGVFSMVLLDFLVFSFLLPVDVVLKLP